MDEYPLARPGTITIKQHQTERILERSAGNLGNDDSAKLARSSFCSRYPQAAIFPGQIKKAFESEELPAFQS